MSKAGNEAYEDPSSNNAGPSGSPKGHSPLLSPGSSRRPSALLNRLPLRRNYSGLLGSGVTNEDDALLKQLDGADDPNDWLNTALSKKGKLEEGNETQSIAQSRRGSASSLLKLDSQLAHLSTVLSISRQDTLSRMDTTMASVTESIPKLGLELRLMRDAALVLRQNIADVRQRASAAEISRSESNESEINGKQSTEANVVLERLASLSFLLERMTAARDVLSLAESWSTLSTDVTAYLADAKFEVAAARLAKAKSSLSVFERTPEYEGHKKLLDGLSNNLENRMTPTLIDAIRDRDIEQAKKFYQVFAIINRQEQFASIWRRTRAEECLAEWVRFTSSKSDERENVLSLLEKKFFESLLGLLEEERKIVGQVLPSNPRENVAKLVTSTLTSLEPGFVFTINKIVDGQGSTAVIGAVDLHHILRRAVIRIADCIVRTDLVSALADENVPSISPVDLKVANANDLKPNSAISTSPEVRPKPLTASNTKRLSVRRMSGIGVPKGPTSSTEQQSDLTHSPNTLMLPEKPSQWEIILSLVPPPEDWEQRLLEPILDLQLNFESLERSYLGDSIKKYEFTRTNFDEGNKVLIGSDLVIGLRKMIDDSTKSMTGAIKRTRQSTYGLSCDGLISCMDDIISSLISHAKDVLDTRTAIALEEAQRQAHEKLTKLEKKEDDMYGMGFASSSSSSEGVEWKAFEEGMSVLSTLHDVLDTIKGLEVIAADQMNDLADVFLPLPGSNPADTIKRLCTDESGTSTAVLRLLLDASKGRLRSGSLIGTLKRMRAIHSRSSKNLSSNTAGQPVPVLFRQARLSLLEQTKGVQRHLTNMILSPLMPHLELYAGLSIWSANRLPGSVNEYDLAMPTFSLSPTEDMSRIGETLLDLPRLLEVWSELPQFKWSVQGLTFSPASSKDIVMADGLLETPIAIDQDISDPFESPSVSMSPKREKRLSLHGGSGSAGLQSTTSSASNSAVSPGQERRTTSGTHRHTPSVAAIATLPARNEQNRRQAEQKLNKNGQQNGEIADAQTALQSYLTSISLTLVSHLISLVLPSIAQLTAAGASQLAADLDYLLTILSALNVTQNITQNEEAQNVSGADASSMEEITGLLRSLEAWRDICKIKDQDGRRLRHLVRSGQAARGGSLGDPIDGFDGDENKLRSLLGTHAFDMVARMRGW
ncbi:hypothetical protein L7F22_052801 [Adiantum nelumboides]|nr:hypothetical protein [Adiantum nelumboides]